MSKSFEKWVQTPEGDKAHRIVYRHDGVRMAFDAGRASRDEEVAKLVVEVPA